MNITRVLCLCLVPAWVHAACDRVVFGDDASETAHGFSDDGASIVIEGACGASARRIRRPERPVWRSSPMRFRLKTMPDADNYLTLELWGGDTTHDHLFATLDGQMLGQMHLGEYDLLDYESCWPRDSELKTADAEHFGVFTYRTFVLPETVVRGKREIEVAVYSAGRVWGYGETFEQFQKPVEGDSRALYSCAIHTGAIPPFARDAMRKVIPCATVPAANREPDLAAVQERSDRHVAKLMGTGFLAAHPDEMPLMAEAWQTKGSVGYRNERAIDALVAAIDSEVRAERLTPGSFKRRLHGDWIAFGDAAQAFARVGAAAFGARLREELTIGGETRPRQAFWADLFETSVSHLTTHRRYFANQMQIIDINAHWSNRALKELDARRGPPLGTTLGYMKEAMGIRPAPNGYLSVTRAGLSKEDGYVGSYGELTTRAAADAYEASIPSGASGGDGELLEQLKKTVRARLYMRYPGVRRDGRRVARLEAQVSWRNEHFPPAPTYLRDDLDLRGAILSRDPLALAAVKDMYEDGVLAERARALDGGERAALRLAKDWGAVRRMIERLGDRLGTLPCFGGDFTWSDPENALVVHKDGDRLLFVNGYWRARGGVNGLAKVHLVTSRAEFVATVRCDQQYRCAEDGRILRLGDFFQYGWMGKVYREGYRSVDPSWPPRNVTAGAERPVSTRGGRAEAYRIGYGPYSIEIFDTPTNSYGKVTRK